MAWLILALATLGSATMPPAVQGVVPEVVAVWSVDGAGSGFPVGEDLVVTALHVTDDRTGAQLRLQDGSIVGGQVIATSEAHDLALIRANAPVFEPLVLSPGFPTMSESVWAIGDPPDDDQGAVAREGNIVSNGAQLDGYVHFTADIRHGFSGGPVINEQGEVVGVIDATTPEGEALAIPADAVSGLIASALANPAPSGRRPWAAVLLIGLLVLGGVLFAWRRSRRGDVRVRLGPIRPTASASPRMEEP